MITMVRITCQFCGKQADRKQHSRDLRPLFCSIECQKKAIQARVDAERQAQTARRTRQSKCGECGTPFRMGNASQLFCSKKCARIHTNRINRLNDRQERIDARS